MSKHQPVDTFSRPILLNCTSALFLLLFIGLGGRLAEALDMVTNPLLVVKLLCGYLVVYSLTAFLVVKETGGAHASSSGKAKGSVRAKVSCIWVSFLTLFRHPMS